MEIVLRRFFDQPVWVRVLRGLLLAGVVALITILTPTPYTLHAPGRAIRVDEIITVPEARTYPATGHLLMTTILAEPASLLYCIYGVLDPAANLTRTPTETSGQQAQSPEEAGQMEISQYLSTRVALEELGYQVEGDPQGLRILSVAPDSPNHQVLKLGDLLLSVQDKKVLTLEQFRKQMLQQTVGKPFPAKVQRGQETKELQLSLYQVGDQARIGVILRPEFSSIELPVKVRFNESNTSGASGGLVFALEIYNLLTPVDLTKGRVIAATGTLDAAGRVGSIEGLALKVVSAERGGATIFLVPRENWPEVEKMGTSMTIIPVDTFQEALDALE